MPEKRLRKENYGQETDEALMLACKKGDDIAFQELMHRYISSVYNFADQYVRNKEDAEDIAQEAFFKTWRYVKRFKSGKKFKPWLFTIARNTALDYIKKKKPSLFSDFDDQETGITFAETISDTEPLAPELFEQTELGAELSDALAVLHPEHRSVIVLRYHQQMTFEEIAEIVGKPMNTVKSWHRRALIRIRPLLAHRKGN